MFQDRPNTLQHHPKATQRLPKIAKEIPKQALNQEDKEEHAKENENYLGILIEGQRGDGAELASAASERSD